MCVCNKIKKSEHIGGKYAKLLKQKQKNATQNPVPLLVHSYAERWTLCILYYVLVGQKFIRCYAKKMPIAYL